MPILDLASAKDVLRIQQGNTVHDAQITRKIASIETDIERVIGGPVIIRQITERCEITAGYTALVLRKRPVVSVVSITSLMGGAVSSANLDIDPVGNIVRNKVGWPFLGPYFQALPVVTVVYTAGLDTVTPPSIAEACEEILKWQWASTRVGAVPPPGAAGQQLTFVAGMPYAIPNGAAQKLAPYALEAYV